MSGSLQLFSFDDYNSIQIAGAQAASTTPIDFSLGTVDLALVEGVTGSLLFLQANISAILAITRAATSTGTDLDSWFADFNFFRLPAGAATGVAGLLRSNTTTALTIPCDGSATLLLADGSQTYIAVADAAQPTFDVPSNTYIIPIGNGNATVAAKAAVAGTAANVPVGTALIIGSGITGVDSAIVVSGFNNGLAVETDAQFRARFPPFLASLSRATLAAIMSAALNVQQGLQLTIANNVDPAGNFEPGNFVVTVDDGSGVPPDSVIAAVDAAVTAYQGNTISHNTRGPTVLELVISFQTTLNLPTGVTAATVNAQTAAVVLAYVNAQLLGTTPFSVSRLNAAILGASTAVANVLDLLVNGGIADIPVATNQVTKLTSGNLTITNS